MANTHTPDPVLNPTPSAASTGSTASATSTPPPRSISLARTLLLFSIPFLLVGLAYAVPLMLFKNVFAVSGDSQITVTDKQAVKHDGARLFAQHCANCHGIRGDGRGEAMLSIPARHFGYEKFKFGSADSNAPTPTNSVMPANDDFLEILRRGIPGSSMPSFAHLDEEQLQAIIGHVRNLTRTGVYQKLYAIAKKKADEEGDEEPNPAKIWQKVDLVCQAGICTSKIETVPIATAASLSNGKRVFTQICANCHGPEGRGDGQQVKDPKFLNDNGTKATPRDLTQGNYKGGEEPHQIYTRIMLGIPGTPMPSSAAAISPTDLLDLVGYVKSLSASAVLTAP